MVYESAYVIVMIYVFPTNRKRYTQSINYGSTYKGNFKNKIANLLYIV